MSARDLASLVKLSHTAFALPFALIALLVASKGEPPFALLSLAVLAVVCARTAAMAYNRFADRDVDAVNPRTKAREIPSGRVSARTALLLTLGSGAGFVATCVAIGPGCALGSVPVLLFVLGYSHAKRFTALCHLWLGVALGLAPVAAYVATCDRLGALVELPWFAPAILGLGVVVWVTGFDAIYACQDEDFDRAHGLNSIPVRLGADGAIRLARVLHVLAVLCFCAFGFAAGLGLGYAIGVAAAAIVLLVQHRGLSAVRVRSLGPGFFFANGVLSVAMLACCALDLYVL